MVTAYSSMILFGSGKSDSCRLSSRSIRGWPFRRPKSDVLDTPVGQKRRFRHLHALLIARRFRDLPGHGSLAATVAATCSRATGRANIHNMACNSFETCHKKEFGSMVNREVGRAARSNWVPWRRTRSDECTGGGR